MSKNEFDQLLLKKLQEEELEYNPAHWDRLAQLLPPTLTPPAIKKDRKWAIATGVAAAIALALATVLFFRLSNQSPDIPAKPAVAHKESNINQLPAPIATQNNEATHTPAPRTANSPAAARVAHTRPVYVQAAGSLVQHSQQPFGKNPVPASQAAQPVNPVLPRFPVNVVPEKQAPQLAENHKTNTPVQQSLPERQNPAPAAQPSLSKKENDNSAFVAYNANLYDPPSPYYEGKSDKKSAKTSISLGGGVNYGNLNAGYTAGVSVRRKLGNAFFVDGAVAMMYNNNASNTAVNNGPPLEQSNNSSSLAARPAAFSNTNLSSPALDPIQKLYYLQFNPSLGYQVQKHVSFSVGGDFQRMLNKNDEIVQAESSNSKVFPNFDVGLTTKSEISITPNIQAGLMYREGLNNLIKNNNTNYVNRRYVQVQFKYNIPVN